MSNIFSVLNNYFEILEYQSAYIKKHNDIITLSFSENTVTVTFKEIFDSESSSLLCLIKDTFIEYTFFNIEHYLNVLSVNITQFPNKNLYFSFNLEKEQHTDSIIIKGYLAKKINY